MESPANASTSVTYAALRRGISENRLAAFSLDTDHDSVAAVSRYMWDLTLAASFVPTLHLLELTFRNAIYEGGVQSTAGLNLSFGTPHCWLDTTPSLLMPREKLIVDEAKQRRGARRQTAGHLIAELSFGFWVRLCDAPYEHGRKSGPSLWPGVSRSFPGAPKQHRNRAAIRAEFGQLRDIRNRVAHHKPIWDQNPVELHERLRNGIAWLNPPLANAAGEASRTRLVFDAGPEVFRDEAARLVVVSPRREPSSAVDSRSGA